MHITRRDSLFEIFTGWHLSLRYLRALPHAIVFVKGIAFSIKKMDFIARMILARVRSRRRLDNLEDLQEMPVNNQISYVAGH
jgi:hypothetical protein